MSPTTGGTSRNGETLPVDQETVAAFLSDPASYEFAVGSVERIDTHASLVFLAGDRAYKLKRALRYPYLDYSTLERRRQCCIREVSLNRRTAPELYLGVSAVTRNPEGGLALGGDGPALEWLVVMRRFPQDRLFDDLGRTGQLTPTLMTAVADRIVTFHDAAEQFLPGSADRSDLDEAARRFGGRADHGGRAGLSRVVDETLAGLAEQPALFPSPALKDLAEAAWAELTRVGVLLDERREAGFVRRCHGDLHLKNICLIDGAPRLFDGIEFNDDLSVIDTLYDLAFLLMDLEHRGRRTLGNIVLNRYLRSGNQVSGLTALPLFLAARALVRAMVNASAAELEEEDETAGGPGSVPPEAFRSEAAAYFDEASAFLAPPGPCLVAVGGLSGSGKSSFARALAPDLGAAPGALILRSDVLRKQLFGVADEVTLPEEAYRSEVSKRVYDELRRRARTALAAGHAVVVDALHNRPDDRAAVEAVSRDPELSASAQRGGAVPFHGFWLDAPPKTLRERVAERQRARGDASDATLEVLEKQLAQAPGELAWRRLDATRKPQALAAEALSAVRG
ncbi:MAG: AAA family ATPase [Kiloniellales bacterium]|nr:AAA family ATPase [Kiloniellales bacterium]